jgi:hypothetical protein
MIVETSHQEVLKSKYRKQRTSLRGVLRDTGQKNFMLAEVATVR